MSALLSPPFLLHTLELLPRLNSDPTEAALEYASVRDVKCAALLVLVWGGRSGGLSVDRRLRRQLTLALQAVALEADVALRELACAAMLAMGPGGGAGAERKKAWHAFVVTHILQSCGGAWPSHGCLFTPLYAALHVGEPVVGEALRRGGILSRAVEWTHAAAEALASGRAEHLPAAFPSVLQLLCACDPSWLAPQKEDRLREALRGCKLDGRMVARDLCFPDPTSPSPESIADLLDM
jgi:hypothetical protein